MLPESQGGPPPYSPPDEGEDEEEARARAAMASTDGVAAAPARKKKSTFRRLSMAVSKAFKSKTSSSAAPATTGGSAVGSGSAVSGGSAAPVGGVSARPLPLQEPAAVPATVEPRVGQLSRRPIAAEASSRSLAGVPAAAAAPPPARAAVAPPPAKAAVAQPPHHHHHHHQRRATAGAVDVTSMRRRRQSEMYQLEGRAARAAIASTASMPAALPSRAAPAFARVEPARAAAAVTTPAPAPSPPVAAPGVVPEARVTQSADDILTAAAIMAALQAQMSAQGTGADAGGGGGAPAAGQPQAHAPAAAPAPTTAAAPAAPFDAAALLQKLRGQPTAAPAAPTAPAAAPAAQAPAQAAATAPGAFNAAGAGTNGVAGAATGTAMQGTAYGAHAAADAVHLMQRDLMLAQSTIKEQEARVSGLTRQVDELHGLLLSKNEALFAAGSTRRGAQRVAGPTRQHATPHSVSGSPAPAVAPEPIGHYVATLENSVRSMADELASRRPVRSSPWITPAPRSPAGDLPEFTIKLGQRRRPAGDARSSPGAANAGHPWGSARDEAQAVTKLQAVARGRLARKQAAQRKAEADAAVKLQAAARGRHVRRRIPAGGSRGAAPGDAPAVPPHAAAAPQHAAAAPGIGAPPAPQVPVGMYGAPLPAPGMPVQYVMGANGVPLALPYGVPAPPGATLQGVMGFYDYGNGSGVPVVLPQPPPPAAAAHAPVPGADYSWDGRVPVKSVDLTAEAPPRGPPAARRLPDVALGRGGGGYGASPSRSRPRVAAGSGQPVARGVPSREGAARRPMRAARAHDAPRPAPDRGAPLQLEDRAPVGAAEDEFEVIVRPAQARAPPPQQQRAGPHFAEPTVAAEAHAREQRRMSRAAHGLRAHERSHEHSAPERRRRGPAPRATQAPLDRSMFGSRRGGHHRGSTGGPHTRACARAPPAVHRRPEHASGSALHVAPAIAAQQQQQHVDSSRHTLHVAAPAQEDVGAKPVLHIDFS